MGTVLQTENLCKQYKRKKAPPLQVLKGINLSVNEGEIFGFLGPNGAGKTTTIRILLGFARPTSGDAFVLGHSIGDVATRHKIGFLPEMPYFHKFMKAREVMDLAGKLFRIPAQERREKTYRLLEEVGLSGREETPVKQFSKGMMTRLGMAQALINDPALLILDEPASGLDPVGRRDMRNFITQLRDNGKTIFFSSHELSEVELISDRVGILNKGEILKIGSLGELLTHGKKVGIIYNAVNQDLENRLLAMANLKNISLEFEQKLGLQQTNVLLPDESLIYKVVEIIESMNIQIISVNRRKQTLEDLFMNIIGGEPVEAGVSSLKEAAK